MPKSVRFRPWWAVGILLLCATHARAQTVTLAWDPNPEPNLAGYLLGYGTRSGIDEHMIDVGLATQWTVSGLMPSQRYYFRVYAYNTNGLRSFPSGEVSTVIGSPGGCTTPDPFASLGGGSCVNGGWLPPSSPSPAPAPTPTPAPVNSGGCTTPDPFASIGGGTCYNGGWLPPGMPVPGTTSPAPPSTPVPSSPSRAPAVGCATPDPFVALGGGTCYNGGWLPPGMPVPGTSPTPPAPSPAGCSTPDPFVSLGGGTCHNGGWLPPNMLLPTGSSSTTTFSTTTSTLQSATTSTATSASSPASAPTTSGGCTTPDPFAGLPGLIGECRNGGWVPVPGVSTTGTVYSFNFGETFWGIMGDDGQIYRPIDGIPSTMQQVRLRVAFEATVVGEVAAPEPMVLIDLRSITVR